MHAHCIFAVFALLIIPLSFSQITVQTPAGAIACSTVQLSWEGGVGPWRLSILSGTSPNPAIENLPTSATPTFNWVVDVTTRQASTVILSVQDSTGVLGQSLPFPVEGGGLVGGGCGDAQPGGVGSTSVPPPTGKSVDIGGGATTTSSTDSSGTSVDSPPGPTDTGTSTSGSGTSLPPHGGSQGSPPPGVSQGSGDPSAVSDSDSSSPTPNSFIGPISSSSSSSTSSFTSFTTSPTQTAAAFGFDSASGSSLASRTNSVDSPGFTLSDTGTGIGGQIQPASSVVQSGVSSTGTTGQDGASNNSFSNKNVMSGAIIGGIIGGIVCVLLVAFCVLRWCRRRRQSASDRLAYPFSHTDTESSGSTPREMVGRSGYPASTFSSWGNHGDLDERGVSPSEGHPLWETGQGTLESRYQAAFTPGHAASSSIDRNDPSSQQRFRSRGPVPKSMTDARHAGSSDSSTAIMGEQPYIADVHEGPPVHTFDEIRPQPMPSWGTAHDMMAGRHPIVVEYPPSYTSK